MPRVLDVVLAASLLVMSPVLLVLAILVRLRLGSPVLFRQRRPGKHEQPFMIVKLRSMTNERDASGALRPDGERPYELRSGSCAARAWMSCPSSSTCFAAR
jgi:lipopolysaccharide/colanic/teichoic acid biosynthesis glycosyltransferase